MSELNGWGVYLVSWITSFDFSPVITQERSCTLYCVRNWCLSAHGLLNPSLCHPALSTHSHTGEKKREGMRKRKRKGHELLVLLWFLTSRGSFLVSKIRGQRTPSILFSLRPSSLKKRISLAHSSASLDASSCSNFPWHLLGELVELEKCELWWGNF